MQIKTLPIGDLTPADYNPRKEMKPGDPEFDKLKRSLDEFGYAEPVIWNETTGRVVGGHQRINALKALGYESVDCVVVELDETREKALNVALNKINGEWDQDKLALLIADLDASDFDAELTGFDDDEIQQMIGSLDDSDVEDDGFDLTAALEEAAFVERGDIWTVGQHRLVCGDATKEVDVQALMEGKKANLVLTDPPYNVAFESSDGLKIANDKMGADSFYDFLLKAFTQMAAATEKGGSAYVFHADTEGVNFRRAFVDAGFHLSGCCVWVKNSLVLGRSPYQWQHEPVLFGWLGKGKHSWYADRKQTTVWNFDKPPQGKLLPPKTSLDTYRSITDPRTVPYLEQQLEQYLVCAQP
ncbi:site-specific DNA-methyltransferase [Scrofimicrobium canadense]|uniref:site-specific DNA-methyltransferase n=1 Tax=Scrofimicrobium canadense TaxID=2652290 RepID=UPI00197D9535|nr:ParB N-terminal domain-containing protein [Scrofimicrobium canadense]